MLCDFETTTHGKWILAGEHTVIRGGGALVFPVPSKKFTLTYQATPSALVISGSGIFGQELPKIMRATIENACRELSIEAPLTGHLHVHNTLPLGVGMGGSAALCVAIARWFKSLGYVNEDTILTLAQQLEHQFHGKSSGLDIAGVSSTSGVYFQKGQCVELTPIIKPYWYLSSSQERGRTSQCIRKVEQLLKDNPTLGAHLDTEMQSAVEMARQALTEPTALPLLQLKEAILKAHDCFLEWGLITPKLSAHIASLYEQGALAVKPTGSGGGGYVLSLWESPPKTVPHLIQL